MLWLVGCASLSAALRPPTEATYPAMMKVFETFDPGFFDLIVADESHRSLYNRYRQLFQYFDCYQVGLTATP